MPAVHAEARKPQHLIERNDGTGMSERVKARLFAGLMLPVVSPAILVDKRAGQDIRRNIAGKVSSQLTKAPLFSPARTPAGKAGFAQFDGRL